MRKFLFFLSLWGLNFFVVQQKIFAQTTNEFATTAEVLAPPPNAASLGKYGGIDVSLNTGMVAKSLPLYNFKSTQLEMPVSLTYSSGGFKVDEAPSRMGQGWILNIGGVITRTVVGKQDDINQRLVPPTQIVTDTGSFHFLQKVGESAYDAEPDIYNFNFNGYAGKFIYDQNNQVVFIPANNLKVEKNVNGFDFRITTPDGVMYYFGGTGAVEQNKKTSSCGKAFDLWVPTAWYLRKMISPLGQEINLTYESVFYSYLGPVIESMYLNAITNAGVSCGTCPDYSARSGACQYTYSVNGVVLKQITSSQVGKINIDYSGQANSSDSLFTRLTIVDSNNVTRKIFDFIYDRIQSTLFSNQFQSSTYRDFLKKVSERSTNTSDSKDYIFSYNFLNQLPVFNTYAADEWGFFNGKTNLHYVPKPVSFYDQSQYPNAVANRDPDYTYAQKGILSKIEYPTKGYDTIIYEANTLRGTKTVPPSVTTVTKTVTGTGLMTQVSASTSSMLISYAQDARLDYVVIDNSGNGSFDPLHNKGTVIFTDVTTTQDIFTDVLAPDNVWRSQVVYPIVGHSYKVTVMANGSVVTTNAIFNYRPGSASVITNPSIGGVRVKMVNSYTDRNAVPVTKRFYYAYLDSLTKSSGWGLAGGSYWQTFYTRHNCACIQTYCSYSAIFSNPQNNFNIYPGAVTYQAVVEGFGNNFENGAIQHLYTVSPDAGPENMMAQFSGDLIPGTIFTNNSYYNGKELETKVLKNSLGQLIPVQKTEYVYKIDNSKTQDVVGCAVNKRYDYCITTPPGTDVINAFNAMRYYHESRWVYVDTAKQTKYNDYGQASMTTYQKDYYDNPVHMLQTRNETKTSTGDILLTQTKYSSDFGTLTGTGSLTQGIKNLNDKYILGAEIEKTLFKKDAQGNNQRLIGSKFTRYRTSMAKPDSVFQIEQTIPITNFAVAVNQSGSVVKDSRYKSQVDFLKYDSLGNIIQQKQQDNINLTYIWDYQKLYPVAGVTNADSASVAYTSFEANGKGNWSYSGPIVPDSTAPTGKKAYTLNGSNNIIKSGLTSSVTYVVSYWTRNGSAFTIAGTISGYPVSGRSVGLWKYFEHRITGQTQVTISGTGSIDEVRLYPQAAQMTTSTYDPLIGLTSQCDPNNRITYYEYDGLGRLAIIRDQDRNVIKRISYIYADEPTDTSTQSPPNVTITSNNIALVSGFTAVYTNTSTGQQYNFPIPSTGGTQTLGSIPSGIYNLTISKPGNSTALGFTSGCGAWIWSTSATFSNVDVSTCHAISMDWP